MDDSYIIANRTDVGKVRDVNEDSMVTFDSPNGRVIAVCDGMGGQAAGDVASRLACDIITDILTNNKFSTPTEAITRACMAANQGIVHRASQNPELEGMGSTCVMVIIKDGLVYYGWVGDSRIYYINHGTIRQLSRDQSYVQRLVDTGQISAAEAEHHPQKNEILNALGLPSMTPPELCSVPLSPEPGSIILLCSDGLSGMVDNNTILAVASDTHTHLPLQNRADKLVSLACAAGGVDNITVQLVQFSSKKGGAKAAPKSSMLMWIIVALLAIVAACVVFFVCFNNNEKTSEDSVEVIDTRSPRSTDPASPTSPDTPKQKVTNSQEKEKSTSTSSNDKKNNSQSNHASKGSQKSIKNKDNTPNVKKIVDKKGKGGRSDNGQGGSNSAPKPNEDIDLSGK